MHSCLHLIYESNAVHHLHVVTKLVWRISRTWHFKTESSRKKMGHVSFTKKTQDVVGVQQVLDHISGLGSQWSRRVLVGWHTCWCLPVTHHSCWFPLWFFSSSYTLWLLMPPQSSTELKCFNVVHLNCNSDVPFWLPHTAPSRGASIHTRKHSSGSTR